MNPESLDENGKENSKSFLRKMRNDIVGSVENKLEYIKSNHFDRVLNYYVEMKENNDIEYLKLIISIINSFVLTHSSDIKFILPNYSGITLKTLKILTSNSDVNSFDKSFYESCFRLLKSLALNGLFSFEKFFNSGFINRIDEYLINDISMGYISIILDHICESSYYKHCLYNNENLIEKIIQKFFQNKNKSLTQFLLSLLVKLTEDNINVSKRIYSLGLMEIISSYTRHYDSNFKVLGINLMVNVLTNSNVNYEKESMVIWSNSILLGLVKDELTSREMKTRIMNILSVINKKFASLQIIFYNLEGVDILLKELKSAFTEEKIKEMEDHSKSIKNTKAKKSERIFLLEKEDDNNIIACDNLLVDDADEYKRSILDCLASVTSSNEDARKKVIENKDLSVILYLIEHSPTKIVLACANLMLSLSRAHLSVKKFLHDYDITSTLFKLSNHSNVEIQIAVTNSLCNFLLDYSSNITEIIECVSRLLKILSNTKHNRIRLNSIFSIKNILYYISTLSNSINYKEIKKNIMKKLTYDMLLAMLDDEDEGIQEQTLIIFRVLLHKTPEDIEEVFTHCKAKLLKKIEEKLKVDNADIILQTLYILINISNGNEKQKSIILDKVFLQKISLLLQSDDHRLKSACVLILNNIITHSDRTTDQNFEKKANLLNEYNIINKLQIIANDEDEDTETKNNACLIITRAKNLNMK